MIILSQDHEYPYGVPPYTTRKGQATYPWWGGVGVSSRRNPPYYTLRLASWECCIRISYKLACRFAADKATTPSLNNSCGRMISSVVLLHTASALSTACIYAMSCSRTSMVLSAYMYVRSVRICSLVGSHTPPCPLRLVRVRIALSRFIHCQRRSRRVCACSTWLKPPRAHTHRGGSSNASALWFLRPS